MILAMFLIFILVSQKLDACAQFLARIQNGVVNSLQDSHEDLNRLRKLFSDLNAEDEGVVLIALEQIARYRHPDSISLMSDEFANLHSDLKTFALQSLKDMGPMTMPILKALSQSSDREVQLLAVKALGDMGAEALPFLASQLTSSDESLVRYVVQSIGRIDGHYARHLMERAMNHSSWTVVTQVFDSLVQMDFPSVFVIHQGLYHSRPAVRALAAESLGIHGDRISLEPVERRLRDPDSHVRRRLIEAVGNIGHLKGLPILYEVLKSGTPDEQRTAADAIHRIANRVIPSPEEAQTLWTLTKAFHQLRPAAKSPHSDLAMAADGARRLIQSKLQKIHPLEYWGAQNRLSP